MSSVREDYYQLLDVEPTASKQELRAAYWRVAKRYHPDRNAGNPAAEERFKLIVEAWRTLGDEEKRRDYDGWLERHQRYAHMPELAGMPQKRGRVSARNAQRRREERHRERRGASPARVRPFALPRGTTVSAWQYLFICLICLSAIVPYFLRQLPGKPVHEAEAPKSQLPPGESPLPEAEQKRNLENYVRRLLKAAEAGDAAAQFRYGNILYFGSAGITQDRDEARMWWRKAAAQGHALAQQALTKAAVHPKASPAAHQEAASGGDRSKEPRE